MGNMRPMDNSNPSKARVWKFEVDIAPDENGNRRRKGRTFKGTRKEAQHALHRFEMEMLGVKDRDVTFADYADIFLERRKAMIKESTYLGRLTIVKVLKRIFGTKIKLSQMATDDIEYRLNSLLEPEYCARVGVGQYGVCKASYIRSIYQYLNSIMRSAVDAGIIVSNPVEGCKQPRDDGKKTDAPSTEQLLFLRQEMDPHDAHEMSVLIQAYLGCRMGESLALRFCDIDFDNDIVHIKHTINRNGNMTSAKTRASVRDLPLPSGLKDALIYRRDLAMRDMERNKRANISCPDDIGEWYICGDSRGRARSTPSQSGWWTHNRAKFGMDGFGEHAIRHGFLTMLARAKVHPSGMQAFAGHESSKISLDLYTHVNSDDLEKAAEKLDEYLEEVFEEMANSDDDADDGDE